MPNLSQEFIARKEFDDRINAIQLQLAEIVGIVKTNQVQITNLTETLNSNQKDISKMEKAIAVSAVMNKYLWPTVTLCVAVIGALLGKNFLG